MNVSKVCLSVIHKIVYNIVQVMCLLMYSGMKSYSWDIVAVTIFNFVYYNSICMMIIYNGNGIKFNSNVKKNAYLK